MYCICIWGIYKFDIFQLCLFKYKNTYGRLAASEMYASYKIIRKNRNHDNGYSNILKKKYNCLHK